MYKEEAEYEFYKSWREDIEFMDRYMDRLGQLLDEEIRRHNQSLVEDEKRKQDNTLPRRQQNYSCICALC